MIKKVLKLSRCSQPLKGWKRVGQFIGGRSYTEKSYQPLLHNPISFINDHIPASDLGPRCVNSIFIPFITLLYSPVKNTFVESNFKMLVTSLFETIITRLCRQLAYLPSYYRKSQRRGSKSNYFSSYYYPNW